MQFIDTENRLKEKPLANPIILFVRNISAEEKEVALFGSYPAYMRNRNPYIIIKMLHSGTLFTYEDVLWKTALRPFFIGNISVTIIRGDTKEVMRSLNQTRIESSSIGGGTRGSVRQLAFLKPEQFQNNAFSADFEISNTDSLSADSSIIIKLPAESEIQLNIYPMAIDTKSEDVFQQVEKVLKFCTSQYEIIKAHMQSEIIDLHDEVARLHQVQKKTFAEYALAAKIYTDDEQKKEFEAMAAMKVDELPFFYPRFNKSGRVSQVEPSVAVTSETKELEKRGTVLSKKRTSKKKATNKK